MRLDQGVGFAMLTVWLGFLAFPIIAVVQADESLLWKGTALGLTATFIITYVVAGFIVMRKPEVTPTTLTRRAVIATAICSVAFLGVAVMLGWDALGFVPFVISLIMFQFPRPLNYRLAAVVLVGGIIWALFSWDFVTIISYSALCGGVYAITAGSVYYMALGEREVVQAATAATVGERERVARDVHDVLGHSLTVISLKADLAAKLIDRDPAEAKVELEEISEISRRSIAEVRSTISGLRTRMLAEELPAVHEIFDDAGVTLTQAGVPSDVDPSHHILFAWVLREAATNVIRHANASTVHVDMGPRHIAVSDDGAGFAGTFGNGLSGLAERVQASGGELLVVGEGNLGGTTVKATM